MSTTPTGACMRRYGGKNQTAPAQMRKALSTTPRANLGAAQVVVALDQPARIRGRPNSLRVDNGPEFAGRLLEAFNAQLRAEWLNASWLLSLADARNPIEQWRTHNSKERPHSALGHLIPRAFAEQLQPARKVAEYLDQNWGQVTIERGQTRTKSHRRQRHERGCMTTLRRVKVTSASRIVIRPDIS